MSGFQPSRNIGDIELPHTGATLKDSHLAEWCRSAVDRDLALLNAESISGDAVYEALLAAKGPEIRRNDGRLTDMWLNRYELPARGGWLLRGLDITKAGFLEADFCCFKPDRPRVAKKEGFGATGVTKEKPVKYEHPAGMPTAAFALRVTKQVWEEIARRHGVPMPDAVAVTSTGEALGFWSWVLQHPEIPVIVTEGAKKAGAILTAGYVCIALPGISGGYKSRKDGGELELPRRDLLPELALLARRRREILFAFDQDKKPVTVKAVERDIRRTARLLAPQGCRNVKVIAWDSQWKGADDLIYAQGALAFHAAVTAAASVEEWAAGHYTFLSYPRNVIVNQRYIEDIPVPAAEKLVCIRAPKGTGKTEWLTREVARAMDRGQRVLVLTHRIQLQKELCRRFGLYTIDELQSSRYGRLTGFGLCVDSLRADTAAQFDPLDWGDALIVIDEVEQVVWHLLHARTEVEKHRIQILQNVKRLLEGVRYGAGTVYASDADLSDIAVDYLVALMGGDVKPYVVENEWRPKKGWNVYHYEDATPERLVGDLVHAAREGGKHLVSVSGAQHKSKWGAKVLERYTRNQCPDKRVLRIDAESVADPEHPAYHCMARLNEILAEYDIIIASPALETGVSIDLKGYFTHVWGIYQGVQTTDSVRQSLARVREGVDRHIWVAVRGLTSVGSGGSVAEVLLRSELKLARANLRVLMRVDAEEAATMEADVDSHPQSLRTWARRGARINQEKAAYRAIVIGGLKAEGHTIIPVANDGSIDGKAVSQEVRETRDEGLDRLYDEIARAENPDDGTLEALQSAREKTAVQRIQEKKGILCRRYGEEQVSAELAAKDDDGFYSKLKLFYFLTTGAEFVDERESKAVRDIAIKGKGKIFAPDLNRHAIFARVRGMEILDIRALFAQDREWRSDDPFIKEIADRCLGRADECRSLFNFRPYGSPMRIVQTLLKQVGLSLRRIRRVGGRKNQVWVYSPVDLEDGRREILELWYERDVAKREASVVMGSSKDLITPVISTEARNTEIQRLVEKISEAVSGIEDELRRVVEEARSAFERLPAIRDRVWDGLTGAARTAISRLGKGAMRVFIVA